MRAIGTLLDKIRLRMLRLTLYSITWLDLSSSRLKRIGARPGKARSRAWAKPRLAQACGQSEDTEKSSTAKCGKPSAINMQQKIGLCLGLGFAVGLGWAGTEPLP